MAKVQNRIPQKLARLRTNTLKKAQTGLERWTHEVHDRMRELVPVQTGNLQDSITAEIRQGRARLYVDTSQAPYGDDVEFGTHDTPAQPYFAPALEEFRTKLPQYVGKELKK